MWRTARSYVDTNRLTPNQLTDQPTNSNRQVAPLNAELLLNAYGLAGHYDAHALEVLAREVGAVFFRFL